MAEKLKLAVVGLNMGRNHCRVFRESGRYHLAAVCDIDAQRTDWVLQNVGADRAYADYEEMLDRERPEVVVVATPTELHCAMTVLAAEYGARGIYCEKPMAISMLEARTMLAACRSHGTRLMIGHQRRRTPVYATMKQLMDEGAIGDIVLVRGTCPGDLLSDGTHTVDSIRYLLGDVPPAWLLASLHRFPVGTRLWGDHVFTGRRFGHSIESGAQVVMEFPGGVRAELLTGSLWVSGRGYQDIEVFGSKGRLWRPGDGADPALLIQDEQGGGWRTVPVEIPAEEGTALDGGGHGANLAERSAVAVEFADVILQGGSHPMDGDNAIATQEIVMAAFESARTHSRIAFPLRQDRFALDLMLETGSIR